MATITILQWQSIFYDTSAVVWANTICERTLTDVTLRSVSINDYTVTASIDDYTVTPTIDDYTVTPTIDDYTVTPTIDDYTVTPASRSQKVKYYGQAG